MNTKLSNNDWVWVVIQNPGGNEEILGQQEEGGVSFIPMFKEKDHVLMSLNFMARDKKKKYEAQAVIFSDLKQEAESSGFVLYLLDNEGRVIDKY